MTTVLIDAPDVRQLAQVMLNDQHRRLASLRIVYAYSDAKPPTKLTCRAYVKVAICSPQERYLSTGGGGDAEACDVLIVVNAELWKSLSPQQRTYCLDDALGHVWADEDDEKLTLVEHDLSVFADVVERHGLTFDSMRHAARVIQKLGAVDAPSGQ